MSRTYERPFEPVDLDSRAAALFPFDDMIAQLREEDAYRDGSRNAFTLVHADGITMVLTVVREGAECQEHAATDPTVLVGLEGTVAIKGARGGGVLHVRPHVAAALAPDLAHSLAAVTDAAYLTIIGERHVESGR